MMCSANDNDYVDDMYEIEALKKIEEEIEKVSSIKEIKLSDNAIVKPINGLALLLTLCSGSQFNLFIVAFSIFAITDFILLISYVNDFYKQAKLLDDSTKRKYAWDITKDATVLVTTFVILIYDFIYKETFYFWIPYFNVFGYLWAIIIICRISMVFYTSDIKSLKDKMLDALKEKKEKIVAEMKKFDYDTVPPKRVRSYSF
jgi:hypothetical protein